MTTGLIHAKEHVRLLVEARGLIIAVKADQGEHGYHPDSDVGKALEAAELSIELAWSLIESETWPEEETS